MSEPRYHINVFWSAEDECGLADVPDLYPCTSHGDTPLEATANVQDGIRGWLAVARDRGFPISEPSYHADEPTARAA